jgi:LmbE family N-acetylglucosaminyl deacetylase
LTLLKTHQAEIDTQGGRTMEASGVSEGHGQPGVRLLVIRPHPDDESSATGGLLAYYHARGVRTGVVICTGGEEGEIHDPTLDQVADRQRLRAIRERELRDACALLGVAELRLLGYRDSGMPGTSANQHRDAFIQADPGEAAGRLVRLIRELRPLVIVTEPPGGGYAHPDHIKCHQVSLAAFQAAGEARAYPEAGPTWSAAKLYAIAQIDDGQWETLRPAFQAAGFDVGGRQRSRQRARGAGPETATVALDVRPYSEIQRQALLAHRTQIPTDSLWRRLPAELYRRAFATAYCLRLHPPTAPGESEQDLFEGLDIKARKG